MIDELLGGDLFEGVEYVHSLSGVSAFLQEEVQRVGNASLLAQEIGTGKGCFHGWMKGYHLPPLGWAVRIAEVCAASLREVLAGRIRPGISDNSNEDHSRKKMTKTWTGNGIAKEKARLKLEGALLEDPPARLSKVSESLEIDRRTLRVMLPDLVKALTYRRAEWVRTETRRRHQKIEAEIRLAAEELAKGGINPTLKRVSVHLQGKVTIFSPETKTACHRICKLVAEENGLRTRPLVMDFEQP